MKKNRMFFFRKQVDYLFICVAQAPPNIPHQIWHHIFCDELGFISIKYYRVFPHDWYCSIYLRTVPSFQSSVILAMKTYEQCTMNLHIEQLMIRNVVILTQPCAYASNISGRSSVDKWCSNFSSLSINRNYGPNMVQMWSDTKGNYRMVKIQ